MYATTLPRSNWLRRASIRLAWYRHMPASSYFFYVATDFYTVNKVLCVASKFDPLAAPNFSFIGAEVWYYSRQHCQYLEFCPQTCRWSAHRLHDFYKFFRIYLYREPLCLVYNLVDFSGRTAIYKHLSWKGNFLHKFSIAQPQRRNSDRIRKSYGVLKWDWPHHDKFDGGRTSHARHRQNIMFLVVTLRITENFKTKTLLTSVSNFQYHFGALLCMYTSSDILLN